MPTSVIPAFVLYCFITSITPGPANLCSLSASMHYGTAAALRQWRGLITGFFIDAMAAVLLNRLLGSVLGEYVRYLTWIGAAYILWMAWHMLRSAGGDPAEETRQPSFRTGLLINLTNGKVILFCVTTLSAYVLPYTDSWAWLIGTALFLVLIGPSCCLVWIFAGAKLKALFARHQKTADIVMAVALALCAVNLVVPLW
ncbi:MAG: LysE family transporter [Oscillospiraceae bacterium]|nr:LysE family transporter [Oscillospiraceae bacterium]